MRRFLPMLAVAAIFVGALPAPGVALAEGHHGGWSHGGGWEHGGGHGRGGGGGPPPWAHDGGRRAPPPGWTGRGRMVAPPQPEYAPPGAYESRGYLRRGGRLPPDVRGEVVPDPWRYRLRPPPRGYNWVRVGNAFALMNMETGQLFDIIPD